jgi:hypothetical protein
MPINGEAIPNLAGTRHRREKYLQTHECDRLTFIIPS